jgi:hypothetical protein
MFPSTLEELRATFEDMYNLLNRNGLGWSKLDMELRYYSMEFSLGMTTTGAVMLTGKLSAVSFVAFNLKSAV